MITIQKSELLDLEKQIADLKDELLGQGFCISSLDALVKKMREVVDLLEGEVRFSKILTLQATTLYLETGLELAKERKEPGIDQIERNLSDSRSRLREGMKEYEKFIQDNPAVAKILQEWYKMRLSKDHAGVSVNGG